MSGPRKDAYIPVCCIFDMEGDCASGNDGMTRGCGGKSYLLLLGVATGGGFPYDSSVFVRNDILGAMVFDEGVFGAESWDGAMRLDVFLVKMDITADDFFSGRVLSFCFGG